MAMIDCTFTQAQADMRNAYWNGAPGILVSGLVWLTAGAVAVLRSDQAAVLALLAGGVLIHPLSVILSKLLGRSGAHSKGNPLGQLAAEGTFWLMAGIAIAFGMQMLRVEWFFPAMLLVIGGRYLTFQTLYGLRAYWVLGGVLSVAGISLAVARKPVPFAAFAGGAVEILFAADLFRRSSLPP